MPPPDLGMGVGVTLSLASNLAKLTLRLRVRLSAGIKARVVNLGLNSGESGADEHSHCKGDFIKVWCWLRFRDNAQV